ncbi:MAG TPA: LacI family DNA-binding transcriptional regulator [Acidimicrobiia bacterium]|nr:LacI family DNA-binding transcriptional regulator [Acidimicrobiia bacterium]
MTDVTGTSHSVAGAANRVASLRDVARAAGVSVSTASRVLSGSSHPVSQGTRASVMAAADELGFQPNRLARALATARTQSVGAVVHDVSDPYYAELVRGLEDVIGAHDHTLLVSSSDRDLDKELSLLGTFVANQVDAIILAASGLVGADYLERVSVVLDRFVDLGGVVVVTAEHPYPAPRVGFQNAEAMRQIIRHLLDLGHTRIGFLEGPPNLVVSGVRLSGYRAALEEVGLSFDPDLVECGWVSMEGGAAATSALMERARPTAIAAGNDLMAFGALRRLREEGVSVPEKMSVVGFDDIEFAGYATVPLTTVRVPLAELGRMGGQLAMDLLGGMTPPETAALSPELVIRDSTAAAAE